MPARTAATSRVQSSARTAATGRTAASGRVPCVPIPPSAPAAPSGLTVAVVDNTHLTPSWINNDSGVSAATSIVLQRATNAGFSSGLTSITLAAGVSSYADSGLSASALYYYRVRADNSGGSSAYSSSASATTAPAVPTSLSASSAGSDKINLTWTDTSSDETSFRLTRATDSGFTLNVSTQSLAAGATSYQATGLAQSTTYYFKIQAVRGSDLSVASSTTSATTDALGVLSIPSIYAPLPHIKVVQAAFASTPYTGVPGTYMDSLLGGTLITGYPNSTSVVEGSTQGNGTPNAGAAHVLSINPSVTVSLYTNITNLYGGGISGGTFLPALLEDWLVYADAQGYSRETAFFHSTKTGPLYSFSGLGAVSVRPPRWFWGIVRMSAAGTTLNNYTQITSSLVTATFGAAVDDYLAVGQVDLFREINPTITTALAGGYTYALEYPTAVDGSGLPTTWATLSTLSDTTSGLTVSGTITFDPPSGWVPASIGGSSKCYYWVRFRCTHTGTTPVASVIRANDHTTSVDSAGTGVVPVYDYAADVGSKGWLTAAEYAGRASGKDAYFAWHSRLNFRSYGTQRYGTRPSSELTAWAQVYFKAQMDAAPTLKALFLDNMALTGANVGTTVTLEDQSTNGTDWYNCLLALWNSVSNGGTRWVWPHSFIAGSTTGDPATKACRSSWAESRIKALKDDWTIVDDTVTAYVRLNALSPAPQFHGIDCNFLPLYPSVEDRSDRAFIAALTYFYQLHAPPITALCLIGGDAGFSWQNTWIPAVAFDVGAPTAGISPSTTTTGNDPAKPSSAPAATPSASGGGIADGTYYYKVSYGKTSTGACETLPNTTEGSFTISGGSGLGSVSIASPAADGLTPGWFLYVGSASGGPYYRQGATNTIASPAVLTSLTLSGTTPIATGQTYKIYRRNFDNAIAYYRPISHTISVAQGTLCDSSAVTVTLPQSMQPLNADGTKGVAVTTFQLRAGEGAIYCY